MIRWSSLAQKEATLRRAGFRRGWWRPATKAAGLLGLKFHELRHTFVALWVAAGADPKEVSVRAGHSSVAFTLDRYGHLYQDAEDDIPERLDALLFASLAAPRLRRNLRKQSVGLLTWGFCLWPQRDLNPCYRLERSAWGVSVVFERC